MVRAKRVASVTAACVVAAASQAQIVEKKGLTIDAAKRLIAAALTSEFFFDMTDAPGEDALDGLKVDQQGNLYSSGPEDGRTLCMTARTGLYRIRLNVTGVRA
jgi:hypothetical protein